jgi:hypothetical protein
MAVTEPEYPALQEQPPGTVLPPAFEGHATAVHEVLKKGVSVLATTTPE